MTNKPSFWRVLRRALFHLLSDKDALIFPIALLGTLAGVVGLVTSTKKFSQELDPRILAYVLIPAGIAFAVFMLRFLSGKSYLSSEREDLEMRSYRYMREFERATALSIDKTITPEARQELVEQVTAKIKDTANETLLEEMREKVRKSEFAFTVSTRAEETLRRIYREIDSLTRRGTLNLVLGVLTAVSGIILLSYVVLSETHSTATLTDFTTAFLPRLSIVTIIEVFAYFFLRLYKSSLNEIKYFQNEATNIEFHFTALLAALKHDNADILKETIQAFLRTERNPLLTGDQRTLTIEQEKLYATPASLSVQQLGAIIETLSKIKKEA